MSETPDFAPGPEEAERRGARRRAIDAYGSARDRTSQALDEAPLIALAGGLAAGALIAALLPGTSAERRLVRPYAERARETARSAAQAAKEAGRGRLDELGLTPDRGRDTVRSIIEGAREAVRASAQAAASTVRGGE